MCIPQCNGMLLVFLACLCVHVHGCGGGGGETKESEVNIGCFNQFFSDYF